MESLLALVRLKGTFQERSEYRWRKTDLKCETIQADVMVSMTSPSWLTSERAEDPPTSGEAALSSAALSTISNASP